jgi:hydrogenase expression/formation protein HypC
VTGSHDGPQVPDAQAPDAQAQRAQAYGAQCAGESCITCSDTAVAVLVVALLDDDLAVVDTGSGHEEVSVGLVSAAVGDTILVHAQEAIAVVPQ